MEWLATILHGLLALLKMPAKVDKDGNPTCRICGQKFGDAGFETYDGESVHGKCKTKFDVNGKLSFARLNFQRSLACTSLIGRLNGGDKGKKNVVTTMTRWKLSDKCFAHYIGNATGWKINRTDPSTIAKEVKSIIS